MEPIILYPGDNRDENGRLVDLFDYLKNELDNRRIECRMVQPGKACDPAAAPVLLAALQKAAAFIENGGSERDFFKVREAWRNAIALAKLPRRK